MKGMDTQVALLVWNGRVARLGGKRGGADGRSYESQTPAGSDPAPARPVGLDEPEQQGGSGVSVRDMSRKRGEERQR